MRRSNDAYSRSLIASVILLGIIVAVACSDSSVEPEYTSHELHWQVDTIADVSGALRVSTIWGKHANRMYLGCSDLWGHKSLQYYDGNIWNSIDLFGYGLNIIEDISGSDSANFIVVGGAELARGIRYRGGKWNRIDMPVTYAYSLCSEMAQPDEMYIANSEGIFRIDENGVSTILDSTSAIYNAREYGGTRLEPASIKKDDDGTLYFTQIVQGGENGILIMLCGVINDESSVIDAHPSGDYTVSARTGSEIFRIGNELVTGGRRIYIIDNMEMKLLYDHKCGLIAGSSVYDNLFTIVGRTLWHYNGKDWRDITPEEIKLWGRDLFIGGIAYADNTLFIGGNMDGVGTVVLRGIQQ